MILDKINQLCKNWNVNENIFNLKVQFTCALKALHHLHLSWYSCFKPKHTSRLCIIVLALNEMECPSMWNREISLTQ